MMDDETNVLIEDGAVEVRLGQETVTVPALVIEASVQWTKRVRKLFVDKGNRTRELILAISETANDPELSTVAFDEALSGGAFENFTLLRDWLGE